MSLILEKLDLEISEIASQMQPQVIIALMDKWEQEIKESSSSISRLLAHYIRLKITWNRIKRQFEDDSSLDSIQKYQQKTVHYTSLIKEARINYYVAKFRSEGQHHEQCSCRGCRCIKRLS